MINEQIIALVGKPNSGKTSLFNLITGLNQKTGNFPGVTVSLKKGSYNEHSITDLPGLSSLRTMAPDESVARDALLSLDAEPAALIFVANGTQLNDSLVLFSEVADLQMPCAIIINFKDEVEKNRITIDLDSLRNAVGCPVLLCNSTNGDGLDKVYDVIDNNLFKTPYSVCRSSYDRFTDESQLHNTYKESLQHKVKTEQFEKDYLKRQQIVNAVLNKSIDLTSAKAPLTRSKKWDQVLLHPIFGMLIFLSVMYLVFQAMFTLSSYPMDWIDALTTYSSGWIKYILGTGWLSNLISGAIIPGIGGVIIFIPQIAILFFLLGILEHSGYLSRISYIADGFLRKFGLSGTSVIPLMSSWACAIPAIMGAKVIKDPKERMAVIMASPLMTCSARLPVYAILIAVLIPRSEGHFFGAQGLALLSLYLLGVVATLVVAWFINKRSKIKGNPLWTLELPVYRWPNWRNIGINVFQKTMSFVREAGKIILGISIVLWLLGSFSPKSQDYISDRHQEFIQDHPNQEAISEEAFSLEYSYLGYMGKIIEPAIKPLGYDWKIGIALIASFAAREVFVGAIATIYSIGSEDEATIVQRLRSEKNLETGQPRFTMATGVSLLLFYVFALQCMSTMAVVRQELGHWKYPIYQFLFMFALAYGFAFLAYVSLV